MSVRIAYVSRSQRGARIDSIRLVGLSSDESWPASGEATRESDRSAEQAAAWLHERLSTLRDGQSLTLLCLDADGGVCAWLNSPTLDPASVAALARQGPMHPGATEEDESPDTSPRVPDAIEFFAGDALQSSIEPLNDAPEESAGGRGLALLQRRKPADARPRKVAMLALSDVQGRLVVDALDGLGVPVEETCSVWHLLCRAWDPGAAKTGGAAEAEILTAVVMTEPETGRLIWAWSRGGKLVAGGSLRLGGGENGPELVQADVSRLSAEWLAWSAQLSAAPQRVVCVLDKAAEDGPQGSLGARGFGEALGKAWPGAVIDAGVHDDPVLATLRRAARLLEGTPRPQNPAPTTALVGLTARPTRQHRLMYIWLAGALLACAAVVGMTAWILHARSAAANRAAERWRATWTEFLQKENPEAIRPRVGKTAQEFLREQVLRREAQIRPPDRADEALPIMQELEAISMVIGNGDYGLDSVELAPTGARVTVFAKSLRDAEVLVPALGAISGSRLQDWSVTIPRESGGDGSRIRAVYRATWGPRPTPQPPAPPPR